jgi:hypothetical protein
VRWHHSQAAVNELLEGGEFIVIDNISYLAFSEGDNYGESWSAMQDWLLQLRRQGFIVAYISRHSARPEAPLQPAPAICSLAPATFCGRRRRAMMPSSVSAWSKKITGRQS